MAVSGLLPPSRHHERVEGCSMTGGAAPRRKGAVWASEVANVLRGVFPAVTLTAPGQSRDMGDAANLPFLAEFKNHQAVELGDWSTQAEKVAIATGLWRWALFVKRRGKAEARDGWMVVPMWFGCELLAAWQAERTERLEVIVTAERLSELWSEERCSWELHYEPSFYGSPATFRLDLEWVTDRDTPHLADWTAYTWQFYADTADEAIADALAFCEGLLPFKPCGACDGVGWYGLPDSPTSCEDCAGTGLHSIEAAS